jgi:hypothetical protein
VLPTALLLLLLPAAPSQVGWSHDVQHAVHSRTAGQAQHATLESLFSNTQQQAADQAEKQQQQEAAAAGQPPCTVVEAQQHSAAQPTKEVQLSELSQRKQLHWHEDLQQQQHASALPGHAASLPAAKQQQQQQGLPDCWDDVDLDSISLLAPTATTSMAPPSSPGGASSSSGSSRGSFSMLGADREVWLVSGVREV